jgi:manganese transport protein
MWIQADFVTVATDAAEFIGAALGLDMLTSIALAPSAALAALARFGILALQASGLRRVAAVVTVLIGVIVVAFAFQVVAASPSAALAGLSASLTLGLRQASRERSPAACR